MEIVIWVYESQLSKLNDFLNGNEYTDNVGIYWLKSQKSLDTGDNHILYTQVQLSYENYEKLKNNFGNRDRF